MDESPYKGATGMRRIWRATRHSLDGLATAYRAETAFRQEVWLAAVMIPLALLSAATLTQKALLVGAVLLVLAVELLNSSVEAAVDRISLEKHGLAKRAKDAGSAAVLVALVSCATVWALVLADVYL